MSIDFSAIRSRLAGSEGRLYWRSLGELSDTPEFRDYLHREFPEQASEWNDPKGRRDFLKLMSASLALAGVGACTKQPPESIVPYVRQPEDIIPGRPLYFASAIPVSGVAHPILAESHMGRPTKIEGNPDHPASLGATDAVTQASVLELYDPDRAQTLTNRGDVRPWGTLLSAVGNALNGQRPSKGAGLRFLTPPITSPALAELMSNILRDFPQARWHFYDAVTRPAASPSAGAHAIYHFDRADVIVSLEGDFLGSGPGSVRYARDFADRRRIGPERTDMSRLYVVESTPTLTGTKADHRLPLAASAIEGFARQLAGALGAGSRGNQERDSERRRNEVGRRRGQGSAGPPRTIARGRRRLPASGGARDRARHERSAGERRHDRHLLGAVSKPRRRPGPLRNWRRRWRRVRSKCWSSPAGIPSSRRQRT